MEDAAEVYRRGVEGRTANGPLLEHGRRFCSFEETLLKHRTSTVMELGGATDVEVALWRVGELLADGASEFVEWRQYAALWVGVVARQDLVLLKLFAAADSGSSRSVHYQDLLALAPSSDELTPAAAWVVTQDAAPEFAAIVDQVVGQLREDLGYA